jgi:hypothetical protein
MKLNINKIDGALNKLELGIKNIKPDSYTTSYPHLIAFFKNKDNLDYSDFIQGIHMIYAWMPTIPKLNLQDDKEFEKKCVHIINRVKSGNIIDRDEVTFLKSVINNSLVGLSKLLHFINPDIYAIWDSRVYRYIHQKEPYHSAVNNLEQYIDYIEYVTELKNDNKTAKLHNLVCELLGHQVSHLRALELIMFTNGVNKK